MNKSKEIVELYIHLTEGLLENKDKKLKETYKNVCKYMEKFYDDVKVVVVNTKRPKGIEKLTIVLKDEINKRGIKYMEAVKSKTYIWIAYRVKK